MIMGWKQKKMKLVPTIKLNQNIYSTQGRGNWGGYSGLQPTGMIEGFFLSLKFSIPGFFLEVIKI